jgi:hypothetical protein
VASGQIEVMVVPAEVRDRPDMHPIDVDVGTARLDVELEPAQTAIRLRSERHILIEIGETNAAVEKEGPESSTEPRPTG